MVQRSRDSYRVGIDCRLLGKQHAGIGRYTENLLAHLPTGGHSNLQWVFFFHDEKQYDDFLKSRGSNATFFSEQQVIFAPVAHYSLDEQVQMPAIFAEQHLDLLHVPHFNIPLTYPGKIVVTIHDLLWHEFRGAQVTTLSPFEYWVKHSMYRLVVRLAVHRAKTIFVPAKTVQNTLIGYFPNAESKIQVTPEGVDPLFFHSKREQHAGLKDLVYVGSLYPHKNIEVVLQALLRLPEFRLHLVGARNVFQQNTKLRVEELGLAAQVKFHGYKSDLELIEIFQNSAALVQPSFFEGFGLTGVEAMASKLPLLASDIPIFSEIYKKHALFFDPKSPESFIAAVHKIDHITQAQLHEAKSYVQTSFSWEKMTKQTVLAYQQVLQSA